MDAITELILRQLAQTIENAKDKIKDYTSKIANEKVAKKRQILELRKEIEQLRVEMKIREGKIIQLNNN
ncbi:hypothetical protein MYP_843 [Sporocytophaga myxococcoides]|uniref:Uncharacterized protein n=1 Tax=Sporocytophaga myxococcoides TaxID=153721 RepID=A0A098L9I7_9BACT|nr:hypothetical protein [Sporocytophaga myxococcoides]GAL83616.1 hypothetical protein MYP_843 [Sporocytophaga myxococcoides]